MHKVRFNPQQKWLYNFHTTNHSEDIDYKYGISWDIKGYILRVIIPHMILPPTLMC